LNFIPDNQDLRLACTGPEDTQLGVLMGPEMTARKLYRTRDEARAVVFDYIERFYNPKRRHSTIGFLSPMEFEQRAEFV
jgi:transposase InsO family protein